MTLGLEAASGIKYPVLETTLSYKGERLYTVPSCCFHDLISTPDEELAGMGLAIIGNLCKLLGKDIFDPAIDAQLNLKLASYADPIPCPWPGMPDDRPVPLDLTLMPFETAMFLDADQLKYRVDRLALMNRIQAVWVPWLKSKMVLA